MKCRGGHHAGENLDHEPPEPTIAENKTVEFADKAKIGDKKPYVF